MQESVAKNCFKYISLNVLGMAALSCYLLADTFFISYALGADGLAALSLVMPLFSILTAVGLMLGIGGGTVYALKKARNENAGDTVFSTALTFGILLGGVFVSLGLFLPKQLVRMFGADGQVLTLATKYLRIIFCFAPFFIINNVMQGFARNDGFPKTAMVAMVAGSLLNVLLDYLFVIVFDGGMTGAAAATGIAPLVGIVCALPLIFKKKLGFKFSLCALKEGNTVKIIGLICFSGLAAFINEIAFAAVQIVFNTRMLSLVGNTGVAAYSIVANIALVVTSLFTGVGQGVQPLLSAAKGHGDRAAVKTIYKHAFIYAAGIAIFSYTLINVPAPAIIRAFNREGNALVASLTLEGFRLYFIGYFFAGFNILLAAAFSAVGRSGTGFAVSVAKGFIAILPAALILSQFFGTVGLWLSYPVAELLVLFGALILSAKTQRSKEAATQPTEE